ncbi:hypothetical protein HYV74_02675 [Candidatus Uhrbacteria bacterium]|nr:hypothetical protein [Candidatus Uhrbacteria bacterium]
MPKPKRYQFDESSEACIEEIAGFFRCTNADAIRNALSLTAVIVRAFERNRNIELYLGRNNVPATKLDIRDMIQRERDTPPPKGRPREPKFRLILDLIHGRSADDPTKP